MIKYIVLAYVDGVWSAVFVVSVILGDKVKVFLKFMRILVISTMV